jgi:hypothetical protein
VIHVINDNEKKQIIKKAQEQFPGVGNNKALLFERPQYKNDLDEKFYTHISKVFHEYVTNYIIYNID